MVEAIVDVLGLVAIDLYAGPGGWDIAANVLGFDPVGIELDDAACDTRKAAGLRTIQADVAALDPADFHEHGRYALRQPEIIIASPPCPSFSSAGLGAGIDDLPAIYEVAKALASGAPIPEVEWHDDRSALVTEPLRWALILKPRWLAWEQVPEVLPFWELCAELLRAAGWNVWTGIIEAERYGVAQTRERAILIADRQCHVAPPHPTHQRYVKGEPQRHEVTLEGEILPWVSMAEALGWDSSDQVGFPRTDDTGAGDYRERDRRPASEPAFTLGEKSRSWDRIVYRNGNQDNAAERPATAPAPTIHFGGRSNKVDWLLRPNNRPNATVRSADEPAPTITGGHDHSDRSWVHNRPATTVSGDPRVHPPGHKINAEDRLAGRDHYDGRAGKNAVRVTIEEAAVLQSFPPDYPFQGTKSKRFQQVGNAVPPLLAHAILSHLLGVE